MIRSAPLRRALAGLVLVGLVLPWSTPALARIWTDTPIDDATLLPAPNSGTGGGPYGTQAVPEINGPGRVSTAGNVWMKTTNIGILGNPFTAQSSDPSAQWPGPSGVEYLFFIGLWVAAKNPEATDPALVRRVSHNTEWRPPTLAPEDRLYQSYDGQVDGARGIDDDGDRAVDEEFLNGRDDDFDGRVDEDYAAISQLMYTCELRDDTEQAENSNFAEKHVGFGLRVQQSSFSFAVPGANDFAAADFKITNDSGHELDSVFVGFLVEQDVGPTQLDRYFSDDLPDARVPQGDYLETIKPGDTRYDAALCTQDTIKVRGFTMTDDDGDMGRTTGGSSFLLLGHTTDPTGVRAPQRVGFRMFRAYLPGTPFVQGGAPAVDIERYGAMSSNIGVDPVSGLLNDERPEESTKSDYFSLCSVGPFFANGSWQPGESISIQIALAVQTCDYTRVPDDPTPPGPDETVPYGTGDNVYLRLPDNPSGNAWANPERYGKMINNAIEVQKTFRGRHQPVTTGESPDLRGRETPRRAPEGTTESISDCQDDLAGQTRTVTDDITVWFDFDCNFCTGVPNHRLRQWLAAAPPPNPGLRLTSQDRKILLEWDNLSEVTPDPSTNQYDFKSYRIWKASNFTRPVGSSGPSEELWALLAELYLYDTLTPLPDSLDTDNDGRYDTLFKATAPVLLNRQTMARIEPNLIQPCAFGQTLANGACIQSSGAPGDTAYVVGLRKYLAAGVPANDSTYKQAIYPIGRYRYEDPNVLNGFVYFYSVTGKDSTGQRSVTGGRGTLAEQEGRRSATEQNGIYPQIAAASREGGIYVVPNPYRGSSQWDLTPSAADPTGTKVDFFNMPQGLWRLKIFTISGDLVEEITSDDMQVNGKLQKENAADGQASWNLISRNGQDVVSGIYMFSVESDAGTSQGKFVIIR